MKKAILILVLGLLVCNKGFALRTAIKGELVCSDGKELKIYMIYMKILEFMLGGPTQEKNAVACL